MKKNEVTTNFIYYADLLKKYDSSIDIRRSGNTDIIRTYNAEYKVTSEDEYIDVLKKIIYIKTPIDTEDLFVQCSNLVNFIVKNSNYKNILNRILPDNQDFKNLFAIAIHIDNSKNIFKSLSRKQLDKVNYSNINTVLANFIVMHNNQELENMETLENNKKNIEINLADVKNKIQNLLDEKKAKKKNMEEKTAVMRFYVEFKKLVSFVKNIDTQIREYDGRKLEIDIENIQFLQKIDDIKLELDKLDKNIILKLINKKKIKELQDKINECKAKIKENNLKIENYKKNTKDLNKKKKSSITDFCTLYNKELIGLNETEFTFEEIKKQFEKIRAYESFSNEKDLMDLLELQEKLNSDINDINNKTRYKDKFYLLYQIKTVCNIMHIPIEEVISEHLIEIVNHKKNAATVLKAA